MKACASERKLSRDLRIGEEVGSRFEGILRDLFKLTRILISDSGHETDALGHAGDEGRCRPRKSAVSCQTSVDPCVSEWGNPAGVASSNLLVSEVARGSRRRELKHLSTSRKRNQVRDCLSSGERKGNSLNQKT